MIQACSYLQLFHRQSSIYSKQACLKFFLGTLFLFGVKNLFSQSFITEFGKVSLDDLRLQSCDFEKSASAMYLLDEQYVRVDEIAAGDFKTNTSRRARIKIFRKEGFSFSNIKISYAKSRQTKISDLEAFLYYLDEKGQLATIKLTDKDILKNKSRKGMTTIAFTFPDIREGCIIEYQYTRTDKNSIRTKPWLLQNEIPTLFSNCTLDLCESIDIEDRIIANTIKVESKKDTITGGFIRRPRWKKSYIARNIPVFKAEPFMSSLKDNLERVEFHARSRTMFPFLSETGFQWRRINNLFNDMYFLGGQKAIEIPGTKTIIDSVKKFKSRSKKIQFVLDKIQQKIKWDEELTFVSEDIINAWKTGSASSAEMNMILLNFLLKAGVEAYPLLTSSRDNGKIDAAFPSLGQFDGLHILAIDDSMNYVLDATQKYLSYATTPSSILNREAFLINTNGGAWVSITDTRPLTKTIASIQATMDEQGMVKGVALVTSYDYSKSQYLSMTKEDVEKERNSKNTIKDNDFTLTIDSSIAENEDSILLPLKQKLYFSYEPSVSDPFYFIAPSFLSSFRKNPFIDTSRNSDIDFGSAQYYLNTMNLSIPQNFEIAELPKSIILRTSDSSIAYSCQTQIEDNIVLIKSVFEIKRAEYSKEEYPAIRQFFEKITGLIRELIVIKKKSK
jgi:hypothetical protein